MTIIKMKDQGLNEEQKARLAEKLSDVASNFSGCPKEDMKVYVYDCQDDQPRH